MKRNMSTFVRLGERVRRIPITMRGAADKSVKPMEGEVIYIHPASRYHVVEFSTAGGMVRESFAGIMR